MCKDRVKPAHWKLTFPCFASQKPGKADRCSEQKSFCSLLHAASCGEEVVKKKGGWGEEWMTQVCGAALCKMFIRLVVISHPGKMNSFVLAASHQCRYLYFDSLWKTEETLRWESISATREHEEQGSNLHMWPNDTVGSTVLPGFTLGSLLVKPKKKKKKIISIAIFIVFSKKFIFIFFNETAWLASSNLGLRDGFSMSDAAWATVHVLYMQECDSFRLY